MLITNAAHLMTYFTNTIWYEVLLIFHHIPAVITLELVMGVQENLCKSRVHGLSKSKQPFTQHLLLFSKGADANRAAVQGSWPSTCRIPSHLSLQSVSLKGWWHHSQTTSIPSNRGCPESSGQCHWGSKKRKASTNKNKKKHNALQKKI